MRDCVYLSKLRRRWELGHRLTIILIYICDFHYYLFCSWQYPIIALRSEYPNIPIHVHTHDTAGAGVAAVCHLSSFIFFILTPWMKKCFVVEFIMFVFSTSSGLELMESRTFFPRLFSFV